MTLILTFLLPIALGLISVRGQNASGNAAYPQWVTNDYNCVIGCMQQQFNSAKPPATSDQTSAALSCVKEMCANSTEQANIYQAQYIINMFNQIGSIYEPQSWQNGNIPTTSQLVAPSGWVQTAVQTSSTGTDGSWTTSTDTVWQPPPTGSAGSNDSDAALPAGASASSSGTASSPLGSSKASTSATSSGGASRVVSVLGSHAGVSGWGVAGLCVLLGATLV